MTPGQINIPSELHSNAEISIEHKEYETKLDLLYDIAQQASSASEVSELLKEIPSIIQKILSASASSLFLVDEEKWQFRMRVMGDKKQKVLEEINHSLDNGIAGWVARNNKPLVIDDVSHEERFQDNIDAISGITTKSIMAAPLGRGSKVIGVLELINKADNDHFSKEDLGLLAEFANTEALNLLVSMATTLMNNFKYCQTLQNQYKNTVETLVTFADAKDPYSYGHSRRVKEYSLITANYLQIPPEELKLIEFGALLHDIGKLGIDDRILRKPESLTTEEWYIIRKHTIKGANIVRLIPSLQNIADLILYHHERHDGKGYPEGLKAEQIPIGSQIIAVSDAFETMTTDRAYRAAMTITQAIDELRKNSGTQFSPKVVEAFINALQQHNGILEELARQQKPKEALKQDITLEETVQNQLKTTEKQPLNEKGSVQKASEFTAVPEKLEKISAGEFTKGSKEIPGTQPVAEKPQKPENDIAATLPASQEKRTTDGNTSKNITEIDGLQPVTDKNPSKEPVILKVIPESQDSAHVVGEILKILTENPDIKPALEKDQKHYNVEPNDIPGHREKQPVSDGVTDKLPVNPETESIVIDITKQKKKEPVETTDLLKNKENQLDAAEMLKKLLGDVRTRKDLQEKRASHPAAEIPAPPKTKEASMPNKSQELQAPVKSQDVPAPTKPVESPASRMTLETKEILPPAEKIPNREGKETEKKKIIPELKDNQLPVEDASNQDTEESGKTKMTPQLKDNLLPVEDASNQDTEESGKTKTNRKQAEKEAKMASKKAEQEAKKEKQEAKKAKKTRSVSKVIDISSELFEGDVKLEITPFIDFKQTDQIKKYLKGINNVKVISQGWSEEEGYIFFLSITKPTVLGPIFQQIPGVQKVYGDGKRIIAEGKTTENDTPEEPENNRF